MSGSAGREGCVRKFGGGSLHGCCQVVDVEVMLVKSKFIDTKFALKLHTFTHTIIIMLQISLIKRGTEVLRMYVKVKKMAGGGEAIVMISKTATIEELKTKVKER